MAPPGIKPEIFWKFVTEKTADYSKSLLFWFNYSYNWCIICKHLKSVQNSVNSEYLYCFYLSREDGELEDGEIDDEGIGIEEDNKEAAEVNEEKEKEKEKEKIREKEEKAHRHSRKRYRKTREKRRSKRRRRDRPKVRCYCTACCCIKISPPALAIRA